MVEEQAAAAQPSGGRTGAGRPPSPGSATSSLGDAALADEIELYGAVVVAASEKEGSLTSAEIDEALGVPPARRAGTPGCSSAPGAVPGTPARGGEQGPRRALA